MSLPATNRMKWKPFPAYKDSGVEWYGKIPAAWKINKLSHAFAEIGSGTTPPSDKFDYYEPREIPWVTTSELRENQITETSKCVCKRALRDFPTLRVYPPGTLLVAMYGATIGRLGILNIHACTNQACCAVAKPRTAQTMYAFYWFQAFRQHIIQLSSGGGQPNINQEKIRALRIPIPSIKEQTAIAAFLDRETARIDALIEKKKRLIELLAEKRAALISHAVTKGLNPDAPMKDSGIEWLGMIPKHWGSCLFKRTASISYGLSIELDRGITDGTPIISLPNVTKDGRLVLDEVPQTHLSDSDKRSLLLQKGDLLFNWRNGSPDHVGKTAYFDASSEYTHVSFLLRLRFDQAKSDPRYYHLLLNSLRSNGFFGASKDQVNKTYNQTELGNLEIIVPPLNEQLQIADFVYQETAKFDALTAKVHEGVERLQEYRTALISAAVTGKIDVRGRKE